MGWGVGVGGAGLAGCCRSMQLVCPSLGYEAVGCLRQKWMGWEMACCDVVYNNVLQGQHAGGLG